MTSSAYPTGPLATSNGPLSNHPWPIVSSLLPPRISSTDQNLAIASSGSLSIPPLQRHHNRCKETSYNAIGEDESYGSGVGSEGSVSGDSLISPSSRPPEETVSRQQLTASTTSNISPSPSTTTRTRNKEETPLFAYRGDTATNVQTSPQHTLPRRPLVAVSGNRKDASNLVLSWIQEVG